MATSHTADDTRIGQPALGDIRGLIEQATPPVVTIAHPTRRAAVRPDENAIHLKTALGQAETLLGEAGADADAREALLAPLRERLADDEFWMHQGEGLVLHTWPGGQRTFRAPWPVEPLTLAADAPHVVALLPELGAGPIPVLAVSQNALRLFEVGAQATREVDLAAANVPTSYTAYLEWLDVERPELQWRPSGRSDRGGPYAWHGHGAGKEDERELLAQFLHTADRGLVRLLDAQTPLVLAGVEYEQALYREITHHPVIADEGIDGNLDDLSADEVGERARPVVEPLLAARVRGTLEEFAEHQGSGLASGELSEVLRAAVSARVRTLLVVRSERRWGRFSFDAGVQEQAEEPGPGREDLVDRAVRETIVHGGEAFAVDAEALPEGLALAAVYRF